MDGDLFGTGSSSESAERPPSTARARGIALPTKVVDTCAPAGRGLRGLAAPESSFFLSYKWVVTLTGDSITLVGVSDRGGVPDLPATWRLPALPIALEPRNPCVAGDISDEDTGEIAGDGVA
jgi:hypothetical protein